MRPWFFVIPAPTLVIPAPTLVIPAPTLVIPELGGDLLSSRSGNSFNKSFPRCVFPRSQIHFVRLFSRETHISVKKQAVAPDYEFYAGENIYYRSDPLPHAETLVTVSPFEFRPRCHPRAGGDLPSFC